MLVLTRKIHQKIKIGDDVEITIRSIKGGAVRIGIDAPRERTILRSELEKPAITSDQFMEAVNRLKAFAS